MVSLTDDADGVVYELDTASYQDMCRWLKKHLAASPPPQQPIGWEVPEFVIYLSPHMYTLGTHQMNRVTEAASSWKKAFAENIWAAQEEVYRRTLWRSLVAKGPLPAIKNHPTFDPDSCPGRGQGEAGLKNILARRTLLSLYTDVEFWESGTPGEPTRLGARLRKQLTWDLDDKAKKREDDLKSKERTRHMCRLEADRDRTERRLLETSEFLYQLVLHKDTRPLLDQLLALDQTYLPPELDPILSWANRGRQSQPDVLFPGRDGLCLNLQSYALRATDLQNYEEMVDAAGKRIWNKFWWRVNDECRRLMIPGSATGLGPGTLLPIEIDVESAITVAGTDQLPIVQSLQFSFCDVHLTVIFPYLEKVARTEEGTAKRFNVRRAEYREGGRFKPGRYKDVVNSEIMFVVVPHPTYGPDVHTVSFVNEGEYLTGDFVAPGLFFWSGSGVNQDLLALRQHTAGMKDERRRFVSVAGVESHRLCRLLGLAHQRLGWGLTALGLVCSGVLVPAKRYRIYSRLFCFSPRELTDDLELYRNADTALNSKFTWILLVALLVQRAPLWSKPQDMLNTKWYEFSIANLLLAAVGDGGSPELDFRRFSTDYQEENRMALEALERNDFDTEETADLFCSPWAFHSLHEPRCTGHERAQVDSADIPEWGAKPHIRSRHRRICREKAASTRLIEFCRSDLVRRVQSRAQVLAMRDEHGEPIGPLMEIEDRLCITLRLHWILGKMHRSRTGKSWAKCLYWAGFAASELRHGLKSKCKAPYQPRILVPESSPQEDQPEAGQWANAEDLMETEVVDVVSAVDSDAEDVLLVRPQKHDLVDSIESRVRKRPKCRFVPTVVKRKRVNINNDDGATIAPPFAIRNMMRRQWDFYNCLSGRSPPPVTGRDLSMTECLNSRGNIYVHSADYTQDTGLPEVKFVASAELKSVSPSLQPCQRQQLSDGYSSASAIPQEFSDQKGEDPPTFGELAKIAYIEAIVDKVKTADIRSVLNPLTFRQHRRMSLFSRRLVTGLEGYDVLLPLTKREGTAWRSRLPQGLEQGGPGIVAQSFRGKENAITMYKFIRSNRRHVRVLEFARRLGHQLKTYPPLHYSGWGDYWRDPSNSHLIRYPGDSLKPIADCLGVRSPRGVIGSSIRRSRAANVGRNRRRKRKRAQGTDARSVKRRAQRAEAAVEVPTCGTPPRAVKLV